MKKISEVAICLIVMTGILMLSDNAFARNGSGHYSASENTDYAVDNNWNDSTNQLQGLYGNGGQCPAGYDHYGKKNRYHKRERFMWLKHEDQEKFQQIIQEREKRQQQYMEYLKETDPEYYEQERARIDKRNEWRRGYKSNKSGFRKQAGRQRWHQKHMLMHTRSGDPDKFGQMMHQMRREKHAKWKRLREENPETFERIATRRRHHMRERLHYLRENNPERFKEAKRCIHRARFERLRELKEDDPEKFQQIMQKRKENFHKHLESLKETDPAKYRRVQNRMKELKHYRQLAKNAPEKAREYLEQNPRLERLLDRYCWQASDEYDQEE